jgi:hypothetical protein
MAKNPTLTINVQAGQFTKFAKDFNDLSKQITQLSNQFKGVAQNLNQATQKAQGLSAVFKGAWDWSNKFHRKIDQITTHFGRWTGLIGGIVTLMSGGGMLAGMTRMSQMMVERNRQMLGIGGSWSANQAAMRAGQVTSPNVYSTLQNIAQGQAGDIEKRNALMALRIYDQKKTPEQIYEDLLRKLPEELAKRPGRELIWAHQYGLDKLMSPEEILRFKGPEGRAARDLELREIQRKPIEITEDAKKDWNEFNQNIKLMGQNIWNFGFNALSPLARHFNELADALPGIIDKIKNMTLSEWWELSKKALSESWKWITDTISTLSSKINEYLVGPLTKFKEIVEGLGSSFTGIISGLWTKIEELFSNLWQYILRKFGLGGDGDVGTKGGPSGTFIPDGMGGGTWVPGAGGGGGGGGSPGLPQDQFNQRFQGDTSKPTTAPGGGSQVPKFDPVPFLNTPGMPGAGGLNLTGSGSHASLAGGNTQFAMNMQQRSSNRNTWSSATNNAVPRGEGIGAASRALAMNLSGGGGGRDTSDGRVRAPLDARNWQSSRVAKISISDLPGSSVSLMANGMAG